MKARQLGERDGWVCWLCDGEVDPDAPSSSPAAPTVDHVVPRSRGGRTVGSNLRLAHRRCNGQRANRLPELDWPVEFGLLDAPSLWQAIARLGRRPGKAEVVALAPTAASASEAGAWAVRSATRFVGGDWSAHCTSTGVGDCHVVRLEVEGTIADPGRPVTDDRRSKGRRR